MIAAILIIILVFCLIWITPYMMNNFSTDLSNGFSSIDIVSLSWWAIWILGGGLILIFTIGIISSIREKNN